MKKRIVLLALLCIWVITLFGGLAGCSDGANSALTSIGVGPGNVGHSNNANLVVTFIDVGQGDAALVQCGGESMLIDVGPKGGSENVRQVLKDKEVTNLKYLVISHWHEDHYGGMGALQDVNVKVILSNQPAEQDPKAQKCLDDNQIHCRIIVPEKDAKYKLGGAMIYVVDVQTKDDNDSLVLLINYEKTNILFTGDIEGKAQSETAHHLREQYENQLKGGANVIKMPHHGAYNSDNKLPLNASDNSLNALVTASYADYFVISVGADNRYKHPADNTLQLIDQASPKGADRSDYLFRTDQDGNITVESNGEEVKVTRSK